MQFTLYIIQGTSVVRNTRWYECQLLASFNRLLLHVNVALVLSRIIQEGVAVVIFLPWEPHRERVWGHPDVLQGIYWLLQCFDGQTV